MFNLSHRLEQQERDSESYSIATCLQNVATADQGVGSAGAGHMQYMWRGYHKVQFQGALDDAHECEKVSMFVLWQNIQQKIFENNT